MMVPIPDTPFALSAMADNAAASPDGRSSPGHAGRLGHPLGLARELAEQAEQEEKSMSLREAWHADRRLVFYSIGFTGTIVMEGYGLALITYLFSFDTFKAKYGKRIVGKSGEPEFEVRVSRRTGHAERGQAELTSSSAPLPSSNTSGE